MEKDIRTHHIHMVQAGSRQWQNYICFRDYLNAFADMAHKYARLKASLFARYAGDRTAYTAGKAEFISRILRRASAFALLRQKALIKIDRPIGFVHKTIGSPIRYPVNYGFIPGTVGGDGEEIDVYLLGVSEPVTEYTGQIIAMIHREDDEEDKLVAVPEGMHLTEDAIGKAVYFQEQYFKTQIKTEAYYGVCK